jgi:hypothetical protein
MKLLRRVVEIIIYFGDLPALPHGGLFLREAERTFPLGIVLRETAPILSAVPIRAMRCNARMALVIWVAGH